MTTSIAWLPISKPSLVGKAYRVTVPKKAREEHTFLLLLTFLSLLPPGAD